MNSTLCALAVALAILCVPVMIGCWLLEGRRGHVQRLYSSGLSERKIGHRLGITRHQVRLALGKC